MKRDLKLYIEVNGQLKKVCVYRHDIIRPVLETILAAACLGECQVVRVHSLETTVFSEFLVSLYFSQVLL